MSNQVTSTKFNPDNYNQLQFNSFEKKTYDKCDESIISKHRDSLKNRTTEDKDCKELMDAMRVQGRFGLDSSKSTHVFSRTVQASGKSNNNNNEKIAVKTIEDLTQIIKERKKLGSTSNKAHLLFDVSYEKDHNLILIYSNGRTSSGELTQEENFNILIEKAITLSYFHLPSFKAHGELDKNNPHALFLRSNVISDVHIFHKNDLLLTLTLTDFDVDNVRADNATFLIHANKLNHSMKNDIVNRFIPESARNSNINPAELSLSPSQVKANPNSLIFVNCNVEPGAFLQIRGEGCSGLSWGNGINLNHVSGNLWALSTDLDISKAKAKIVKVAQNGNVVWEQGDDRKFTSDAFQICTPKIEGSELPSEGKQETKKEPIIIKLKLDAQDNGKFMLRGQGGGLAWNLATPLVSIGNDLWIAEIASSNNNNEKIEFKITKEYPDNKVLWETFENRSFKPGQKPVILDAVNTTFAP